MNFLKFFSLLLIILALNLNCSHADEMLHHNITIEIDHDKSYIKVIDTLENYSQFITDGKFIFELNQSLKLNNVSNLKFDVSATHLVYAKVKKNTIVVYIPDGFSSNLVLEYEGIMKQEQPKQGSAEFARAGAEYDYILNSEGAYLSLTAQWFPFFRDDLFTFDITTISDEKYKFVNQGDVISDVVSNGIRTTHFECNNPMDNIYIVSGPFYTFEEEFGGIKVQAYLRENDKALATKYIKATEGFLDTYVSLIGDYPYSKFTLVENTEQTGWGMPSFTLLGSKIIRFPFILMSSYPHELLHNWWGNSVYVDYTNGNWCEGLTSYLADHLIKEQEGTGSEYRKTALERYTFYVQGSLEKPVELFTSKDNAVTEAIGYSKVMMIFHMLRVKYGNETFTKFLQEIYQRFKFKAVTFVDLFEVFAEIADFDSKAYFEQWIKQSGAPTITLSEVKREFINGNHIVNFTLNQTQEYLHFDVEIPVYFKLDGQDELVRKTVRSNSNSQIYSFSFDTKPIQILVDPLYDVMRRLLPEESAPTLANVFGDGKSYIVLPSASKILPEWEKLANFWKESQNEQKKNIAIIYDKDFDNIPSDYAVWVVGKENKFYDKEKLNNNLSLLSDKESINKIMNMMESKSAVAVVQNPTNKGKAIAYFTAESVESIAALGRKLPHYGKYSYLGFEGNDAENKLKGVFDVKNNPFIFNFEPIKHKPKVAEHKSLTDK